MDKAQGDRSVLIWVATAGVLLSASTTVTTFTRLASGFTVLRYPLLGAALGAVAIAGWSSGRLPAFNRTLWACAPWWARLSWLAILAAVFAAFATVSLTETFPRAFAEQSVLETRGISAVAAYLFLIAGLRRNVDVSLAKAKQPDDAHSTRDEDSSWTVFR
jgi:hypothetical protein